MSRGDRSHNGVRVSHSLEAGGLVRFAAHELAAGLGAMLGEAPRVEAVSGLDPRSLAVEPIAAGPRREAPRPPRIGGPSRGCAAGRACIVGERRAFACGAPRR